MTTSTADVIIVENLDPTFRDEVARMPGGANIAKCFACGTCAAGCPVTSIDEEYNSRSIIRKILYGMRAEVLSSPAIWLCVMCYRCYARCPQQVNFTDIMRALRHMAVRDGYAPAEMLAKEDEADKKAQMLRRELVRGGGNGKSTKVPQTVKKPLVKKIKVTAASAAKKAVVKKVKSVSAAKKPFVTRAKAKAGKR
jgi:heterodisulfide reductase subunit C